MYKKFQLTKFGEKKKGYGSWPLYTKDFECSLRPLPGEWVIFESEKSAYWGFVNLNASEGKSHAWVVTPFDDQESAEDVFTELLKDAIARRKKWSPVDEGGRIVFGSSDKLPGLIVDAFSNVVIVQIETAGIDYFRTQIEEILKSALTKKIIFWDKKSRLKEGLPLYKEQLELEDDFLEIRDSGFKYQIAAQQAQKSGYYYDHRKNRQSFERLVSQYNGGKLKGVDLFSYLGSWGHHQLRAGVENVDFVDQANLSECYAQNLEGNKYSERGTFVRESVFDFLKKTKNKYNVISCDPPAFAKSKEKKREAIRGYQRLHSLVLGVAANDSLIAFASCTQYVNMEEFEETILNAARQCHREIKLVDIGLQAWDHPIPRLKSSSNYIKYLAYTVS